MNAASGLLTVDEVAVLLRVKPRYVYQLASSGELVRVYVGRYDDLRPDRDSNAGPTA